MSKKVGIVTGGGDCAGLNAVIRAVAKAAAGADGKPSASSGATTACSIRRARSRSTTTRSTGCWFAAARSSARPTAGSSPPRPATERGAACRPSCSSGPGAAWTTLGIDALVTIGGDGSLAIAQQLHEFGIPVVGVPKTIDNDVGGTQLTFGFLSAVDCVTEAIDRLHTTAESHGRVMVVEVMGRYAGWIALWGGIAGGADVILIPEIPFSYDAVVAKIREREARLKHFTLVVVAEGAREKGGDYVTSADQPQNREARLGGIGAVVSAEIERRTGKESRVCVLGHLQRGGSPSAFDRALCSMFGTEAMDLVAAGDFGKMVAFLGTHVGAIPIADAVGKLKTVPPDGDMSLTARNLGICLGD